MQLRQMLAVIGLVLVPSFFPVPSEAQAQIAGNWELSSQGPRGGDQTMTLVVEMNDGEMTGTLTLQRMGEHTLEDVSVDGAEFSFSVTLSMRGNSFKQKFSGTVDGDEMSGAISGARGQRVFTGKRVG
ncbi:MAG: hypothetical protein CME27_07150 [Gemmatimonadetes bacterium]|nr:hypothetical protein [Gemmatimonadota bacterium]|tara:strand:+ start:3987 stop:4370 length:384 start_codon:yes stop_codon:yes gene_type:complete